jgi:hypothetical protein
MPGFKSASPIGSGTAASVISNKQLLHKSAMTSTPHPVTTRLSGKTNVVLFHLDEVARFVHAVGFAEALANNIKVAHHGFWEGGDQLQESDMSLIREQAANISGELMTAFSNLCRTGNVPQVQSFLADRAAVYQNAMQQVSNTFGTVQKSNQQLQSNLQMAAEIAHIVHGLANTTESVLGLFAGGSVVLSVLQATDSGVSAYGDKQSVVGAVQTEVATDAAGQVAGNAADQAAKQATKTLTNIVTRDWKYQGALQNAQVRLAGQAGVATVATGVSVFFAAKGAIDGLKEAADNYKSLTSSRSPTPLTMIGVPRLAVPSVISR